MKTIKHLTPIIALGLAVASFIAGMHYHRLEQPASPQHLTLEQILSIRELHLVKHTYTDLFMLHKQNNPAKAIRAMVQVPVTVTAYLNLKDIELTKSGDSICNLKPIIYFEVAGDFLLFYQKLLKPPFAFRINQLGCNKYGFVTPLYFV